MITSIFNKSKPINFIIVITLVIIGFLLHSIIGFETHSEFKIHNTFNLFIAIFSIFLVDFIISKNDLTKRNSYGILIFGITLLIFPEVYSDFNILFTNLLVLFATRRLLSLHTGKFLKKKFFDAAFWISLACLFNSWMLLFIVVLITAFLYYWQNEIRYLFVIFTGILTVFILLVVYNILFEDQYLPSSNFNFNYSFDYTAYNDLGKIISLTLFFAIFLWCNFFYLKKDIDNKKRLRPIRNIVFVISIVSVIIVFMFPKKSGGEFIFFSFPFAVMVANYIQNIDENWFRDLLVILLILAGVINLIL